MVGIFVVIVSVILVRIPYIGEWLRVSNTLMHEFGHALGAKLTFGKVDRIELYPNASGMAYSRLRKGMSILIATFMGYPFASLIALWFIKLIGQGKYDVVFNYILIIALISLVFWIRNGFGALWATIFIIVTYFVKSTIGGPLSEIYITIIVGILFVDATMTGLNLVILHSKEEEIIDSEVLRDSTGIPAGFWSYCFAGISAMVFIKGMLLWYGI